VVEVVILLRYGTCDGVFGSDILRQHTGLISKVEMFKKNAKEQVDM
jgi:hypothetical protein